MRNKYPQSIKAQTQLNMAMSIVYQVIAAVCSLILPRYILLHFGSDVNGVLQSISQLLSYTVIMECGVGGLITASFYKPLATNDKEAVSDIFNNSKKFFGRISGVYVILVLLIAIFSKIIIKTEFSFKYLCSITFILGINYYFSYYFALSHRILLRADQKLRIIYASQSITLILNLIVCVAAIKLGAGIHTVKIVSALAYLLNPIVFRIYVKRHYSISNTIYDKSRTLPRKSDGMIHHLAFFIHMNTDILLISVLLGTKEVSVYSVYNSVIYVIENFFATISESISTALGNFIAKGDKDKLKKSFEMYNFLNIACATVICIAEAVVIIPFVKVYTGGITDADYLRRSFAYIMILAQWFYCIRMPYVNTINAAGHYKQTKVGAFMEALLNILISVLALKRFGLPGVALGTAVAMCARSIYMAWYLSRNILYRKTICFIKETIINGAFGIMLVYILSIVIKIPATNLFVWGLYSAIICIITVFAVILFNIITNKKMTVATIKLLRKQ